MRSRKLNVSSLLSVAKEEARIQKPESRRRKPIILTSEFSDSVFSSHAVHVKRVKHGKLWTREQDAGRGHVGPSKVKLKLKYRKFKIIHILTHSSTINGPDLLYVTEDGFVNDVKGPVIVNCEEEEENSSQLSRNDEPC